MSSIHIETILNSDTLYLPQLKPMLGMNVEIVVREKCSPVITPPTSDWSAVEAAIRGLENYDAEAYRKARDHETARASECDR
jgi:hypothetical protein